MNETIMAPYIQAQPNLDIELGYDKTRSTLITTYLRTYLNKYHSDMRWMIKYYQSVNYGYQVESFRGAIFQYLDFDLSGENIIIYGAPQHEYFYDRFDNEAYHEFCYPEVSLDLKLLGLID